MNRRDVLHYLRLVLMPLPTDDRQQRAAAQAVAWMVLAAISVAAGTLWHFWPWRL